MSIDYIWRKKYRQLLFFIGLFGILFIIFSEYAVNNYINFNNITASEKLLATIYFLTGVIIFWYTRETYDLKKIQQKELKEIRKQTDYSKRPYLRLQWKDKNMLSDQQEEENKKFTSLQLVNDGKGIATHVEIVKFILKTKQINLKHIPVISVGGYTQLEYENHSINDLDVINRNQYIEAIIQYKDISKEIYKVRFRSKAHVNDGFKIYYQDKIKNLKK